jgi:fructokinase
MLNTAVSLGRSGIQVNFISEIGDDIPGGMICDFLKKNNVLTEYVQHYENGRTAIALAFLDNENNADYSFYKHFPENRLNLDLPLIGKDDILIFGSSYAITGEIHEKFSGFVRHARENGALIIYDPNFRKSHLRELDRARPWILENISMSDIIRGSDEDFLFIFGAGNSGSAFQIIKDAGCRILIYTKNKLGVEVVQPGLSISVPAAEITPKSTIGAGDAFNAGLIHSLVKENATREGLLLLGHEKWKEMISTGVRFSTNVCLSFDNYISSDFVKELG